MPPDDARSDRAKVALLIMALAVAAALTWAILSSLTPAPHEPTTQDADVSLFQRLDQQSEANLDGPIRGSGD